MSGFRRANKMFKVGDIINVHNGKYIIKEIIDGKDVFSDELIVNDNKRINNADLQLEIDTSKRIKELEKLLRI